MTVTEFELQLLIDSDDKIKAMSLKRYLHVLNSISRAWQAEKEGRFAGLLTEELDHWADYNIFTAWELAMYLDGECDEVEYD